MTEIQFPDDNEERFPADEGTVLPPAEEIPASPVFRRSRLSYLTLFFLLLLWPAVSLLTTGDPAEALKILSASPIFFIYLPTMVIQWMVFLLVFLTTYREGTGLAGIGFGRFRLLYLFWGIAFLLVSNLLLSLISLLLTALGLTIPGELELILPKTGAERIIWAFLAATAAICEESAFRGYLITRIKILSGLKSWVIPIILSSLAFGSGHAYQGVGGFILISIYGSMFALLFLKTKSLWPVVIAHFFQDFSALFFPFQK
ncbi:putative Abortive infection protein [Candidatus Zixiibacteriota bacterium]|nr:putative Abortive infection protein [candidate division Zixibacteria bacterium]